MGSASRPQIQNRLLAAAPFKVRKHLLARCEKVQLALGEVVCRPGEAMHHVYFPLESFVAMVAPMADGTIQVGMVGNEGMVGISLMLGVRDSSLHGLVQGSGSAWKIAAGPFRQEVDRNPGLRQVLNRYLCVLIGQLAQNTGCARFHLVEARLARWLLMARDRAHRNSFFITHEFLSDMLGVRRVGVTNAASALQAAKLIRYSRGNVTILNNRGLEAAACECYREEKLMYENALGQGA
ncbi:MAG: Crp/Fnr family transcriptional regulator [Chromatiales bacterium]|nr:Crp/Fnr family transcriptional regulator [Chromatiales bacterium]